ncbi:hypothetical protein QQP08_001524 [Theobroma cacao]|nr:hypothetical protein QQP08_001524 [Theobroma cacao]
MVVHAGSLRAMRVKPSNYSDQCIKHLHDSSALLLYVPGRLKSSLHFGCMVPRLLEQTACKFNCPGVEPDQGPRGMEAMLDHGIASFTGQTLHCQQLRPRA